MALIANDVTVARMFGQPERDVWRAKCLELRFNIYRFRSSAERNWMILEMREQKRSRKKAKFSQRQLVW